MSCDKEGFESWDICEEDLATLTESTIFSIEDWHYSQGDGEVNKIGMDSSLPALACPHMNESLNDDPIAVIDNMIAELANSMDCPDLDQFQVHALQSVACSNTEKDWCNHDHAVQASTFCSGWIDCMPGGDLLKNSAKNDGKEMKVATEGMESCLKRTKEVPKDEVTVKPMHETQPLADLKDLDLEVIATLFHLPISEAAKRLGVGATVLKKRCRRLGIPRWPYRKLKSLDNVCSNLEKYCHKAVDSKERFQELQAILRLEKEAMIQKPSIGFNPELRRLRQELFKHGYKFKQAQQRACLNVK